MNAYPFVEDDGNLEVRWRPIGVSLVNEVLSGKAEGPEALVMFRKRTFLDETDDQRSHRSQETPITIHTTLLDLALTLTRIHVHDTDKVFVFYNFYTLSFCSCSAPVLLDPKQRNSQPKS